MAPPLAARRGCANLAAKKTDRRLDAMTASHSSVVSTNGLAIWMAALFTSASSVWALA